jgi:hypothetical protein
MRGFIDSKLYVSQTRCTRRVHLNRYKPLLKKDLYKGCVLALFSIASSIYERESMIARKRSIHCMMLACPKLGTWILKIVTVEAHS